MTDPTYSGVGVAIAAARHARELGIGGVHLVVNRVRPHADRIRVEEELEARAGSGVFDSATWIPYDELVLAVEPSVDALLDIPREPFIGGVERLTGQLEGIARAAA